jgi:hypothetical protein
VGVERVDRLQPPRLALGAFGGGPADGLPVGGEDDAGAGVAQFDPVAAGLPDVEEERLLNGVLVRSGLDVHAGLEEHVRGAEDVLPGIGREGDVVQSPVRAGPVLHVHEVVGLVAQLNQIAAGSPSSAAYQSTSQ